MALGGKVNRRTKTNRLRFLQDARGAGQKRLAVRRQLRLPLHAIKEPLSKFLLDLLNLPAQGGLRDVALPGGSREVSSPGHRHDISELMHFHRQCL